jgi:hypothetical protein
MSSSMPQDAPRSKTARLSLAADRARTSFGNRLFDIPTNPTPEDNPAVSIRSIESLSTYIVWSIFNLIFVPFGILCCYFSHKVSKYKLQNRYEKATKWSKRTFVLNLMTTLLMFGVIITIVMLRNDFIQRNSDIGVNDTQTTIAYIPWLPGR